MQSAKASAPLESEHWVEETSAATVKANDGFGSLEGFGGVEVFAGTVTAIPGEANEAAVPLAAAVPEQSAVVNRRTVDPASAEPSTFGDVPFAGDAGLVAETVGAAGG